MRGLYLCLVCGAAALAQSSEAGRIDRNGSQATLIVDNPRPLDSAAITIAEHFGIPVNTEDPPYAYRDDVVPNAPRGGSIPRGGRLEVQFTLGPDGSPDDIRGLLQALVDKANTQFPFAYRLDADGDSLTLVPTRTHDVLGRVIEITPLLDRRVTIPPGVRTIAESATLMADSLSAQTGLRVSCGQASVAGIPWGMRKVAFEARDELARSVLKRLIAASLEGQPNGYYWLERCDPLPSRWCFINLQHTLARTAPPVRPAEPSLPPDQTHKWFESSSPTPLKAFL